MKPTHTIQSSPPLLRRTQLLPGESLVSLLERLTQLNYYPSPCTLSRICRQHLEAPANQDDLARPNWVETFLQLADLTLISPEELYAASDHHFAPVLAPPQQPPVEIPWIGSTSKAMLTPNLVRECLRSASTAQYCPRCLKTAAYHRLSWTPASAAICLEHHCLLVHRCPQCQKRISIQEIVRRRCRVCQADLGAAEPISVEGNELGIQSQQLVQSCFAGAEVTELPGMGSLPSRYPAVLYRILENLSRRLLMCWKDWPALPAPLDGLADHIAAPIHKLQTLTPEGIFYLQKAAFTCVTNWPDGLFLFLDAYSGNYSPTQTPANRANRLRLFRHDWFQPAWSNPGIEFVQQGFVNYLLARNVPLSGSLVEQFKKVAWFAEQTGLWSEEQVALALDLSDQELHRFLSHRSLNPCLLPRPQTRVPLFERDKVLTLKQKWALGWSVSDAGSWLGLYDWDVLELAKRGVLAVVDRPDGDEAHWLLSRQSVETFFERVAIQLELFQGDRHNLACLDGTACITASLGVNRVALLLGVADGFLPALKRKPQIQSLGRIYFLKSLVYSLPDLCYARRGWVAGHMFAQERGFPPSLGDRMEGYRLDPA
jgi:hypothetical protein